MSENHKKWLNLDGNYAQGILSYYLWGKSTPPASTEIAHTAFIRAGSDGNIPDEQATQVYVSGANL